MVLLAVLPQTRFLPQKVLLGLQALNEGRLEHGSMGKCKFIHENDVKISVAYDGVQTPSRILNFATITRCT